jgi:cell division septal protein FtsQ
MEGLAAFRRQRRRQRAPRRRGRRVTRVLLAAGCLVLVLAGAAGLRELALSPLLRIARVEISGCHRQHAGSIRDLARPYLDRPILTVDIAGLRAAIESQPIVRSATVARRLPDLLDVRVDERRPVARIADTAELLLADHSGFLFAPAVPVESDRELPALRGGMAGNAEGRVNEAGLLGLQALGTYTRITGEPLPLGTVVDVSHEQRIALRPGPGRATLWLDRNEPTRNLARLLSLRGRYDRLARAEVIDLRFPDRLTVVRPPDGTEGR